MSAPRPHLRLLRKYRRWRLDRHERLIFSECRSVGAGTHINGDVVVKGASHLSLGANVHIGAGAYIKASGGLTIGDNTHISRNLVLYTANHDHRGTRLPYDEVEISRPVSIGRNVWIGMNVCIAPGSSIGDGAIIGMGTVVHGEVPPLAIVGAPPWIQIGARDEGHYHALDESGEYGGPNGRPIGVPSPHE